MDPELDRSELRRSKFKILWNGPSNCKMLKKIPSSICKIKSLKLLDLSDCLSLEGLPEDIGSIASLRELRAGSAFSREIPNLFSVLENIGAAPPAFYSLPPSLDQLINVETLTLTECKYLREIQGLPPKLSDLFASYCTSIESLDVSKLDQLRFLYLSYCSSLVKVEGLDKLASIKRIDMAGCEKLSITFEENLMLRNILNF
ncbi:hypothetical protein AgCh_002795 [Apium graveolens]